MMKGLILALVMFVAMACAEDADPVAKFLKELGSDDFATREAAEKVLIAYIAERPAQVMELGHRLLVHRQHAEPEVQTRLGRVLQRFAHADKVDGPDDAYLGSSYGDMQSSIQGLPCLLILVTSLQMFSFHGPVARVQRTLRTPECDFKDWILVCMESTHSACLKDPTCRRDFQKKETSFHSRVGSEKGEPFQWAKTSVDQVQYRLHVNNLPLRMTFAPVHGEVNGSQVTLRYQVADAQWRDVEKILKEGNLYAFRKLAESCDAAIPADTRRNFLQKAYMLDPLLPYVMFTHLAQNHPKLFREDYEYWKDKAPDADKSRVVGKLFRAALEEGKKIVEEKEKANKAGQ